MQLLEILRNIHEKHSIVDETKPKDNITRTFFFKNLTEPEVFNTY